MVAGEGFEPPSTANESAIVTLLLVLMAVTFGFEPKHPTYVGLLAIFKTASFPVRIKSP